MIERFEWVFFLFGAFLLYTGYRLAFRRESDEEEFEENAALRLVRRFLPVTDGLPRLGACSPGSTASRSSRRCSS